MDNHRSKLSTSTDNNSGRRNFIRTAATGGAAAIASGLQTAESSASVQNGRKLRVGAMCVGDFSFWGYSWGDLFSPGKPVFRDTLDTGLLNMEVTHVWDKDPSAARKFADIVGADVVDRYDGMVGKVDGVAFGGFNEVPWQHKLARPYIEAGIPTYLSRPFAYTLRDIDNLLDLGARHNTPIMATDVYEHLHSVPTLKKKLGDIGEIECVHGTCLTQEYPALFHSQFMIQKIFGNDIGKVSIVTDNPNASSYLAGTYIYNKRDGQKTFPCTISMTPTGDLYSYMVSGTKGIINDRLPQIPDWRSDLLTHHVPMLVDMQRNFEGKNFEPFDDIRKKVEIFLTGFYSAVECDGGQVAVGSVPVDWRATPAQPGWIDDSIF
ncbi:hypothetical protein ACFL47_08495 [Candidatus Latescibacterota bacterium]